LLSMPSISSLESSPDSSAHFSLLRLFAYGTYSDLASNPHLMHLINPPMLFKLRQLSVISLASRCRSIPYHVLLTQLGLDNPRQLEDLIIESIYRCLPLLPSRSPAIQGSHRGPTRPARADGARGIVEGS
jgi:COP9 signalosome complex subunit 7